MALPGRSTLAAIIITYRGLRKANTPGGRLTLNANVGLLLCFHSMEIYGSLERNAALSSNLCPVKTIGQSWKNYVRGPDVNI